MWLELVEAGFVTFGIWPNLGYWRGLKQQKTRKFLRGVYSATSLAKSNATTVLCSHIKMPKFRNTTDCLNICQWLALYEQFTKNSPSTKKINGLIGSLVEEPLKAGKWVHKWPSHGEVVESQSLNRVLIRIEAIQNQNQIDEHQLTRSTCSLFSLLCCS